MSVNVNSIELIVVSNNALEGLLDDIVNCLDRDMYIVDKGEYPDKVSDAVAVRDFDDDILEKLEFKFCPSCERYCVDGSDGTVPEVYYCEDCDEVCCEYCGYDCADGRWRCPYCYEVYEEQEENNDARNRLYDAAMQTKKRIEREKKEKEKEEEKSQIAQIAEKLPF